MLPPQLDPARIVPVARHAEALGYDLLACGEHVFFHVPTPNAFVALAAAAGATSRIRLVSAATLLPVYPAPLAAKMAATLDGISGGRFELGVGVGGEFPPELVACGVEPALRGRRADEALRLITRLLAGERVRHDGEFWQLDGLRLDPVPSRRLPIWVGGRRRAAIRRAGRFADVWMPYMVDPARFEESLAAVRAEAAAVGRAAPEGALFCWAGVDADGERARRTTLEFLARTYQQDFGALADRYVPAGTPAQVAARLREYAAAGAGTVLFAPAVDDGELERAAEMFIDEVAPALVAA